MFTFCYVSVYQHVSLKVISFTFCVGSGVGNDTTQRTSGAYSHSLGSVNHSRGSSLAEEPYVPMGPTSAQTENYVDMDTSNSHRKC